jgi:hypothetical protein
MADFDDAAAVKFIQNYLPQELKERLEEDDVYYFLDVICEFYEKRNWLSDDDEVQEEADLIAFIIKEAQKDEIGNFSEDEIRLVLAAEAAYSETLDIPE